MVQVLVAASLVVGGIILCIVGCLRRRRARILLEEQAANEARDSPMESAATRRLAALFPAQSNL